MTDMVRDELSRLSEALEARTAAARAHVAAIRAAGAPPLSATLWRPGVAIASDQVFPKATEAELLLPDGGSVVAQLAGRDAATNIVALRYDDRAEPSPPPGVAEPRLGALALLLAIGRDRLPVVRLGLVRSLGPAWYSRLGGHIAQRIALDLTVSSGEEGGPVFDMEGRLLGMSTAGPGGRALVIPAVTIERVLGPLLATGRVERGWLGAAVHRVAVPSSIVAATGLDRGLMVLKLHQEGPMARAGVMPGDILIRVGEVPAGQPRDISRRLGADSVGQLLPVELVRAGALITLSAVITARPSE